MQTIQFTLNGRPVTIDVEPQETLLRVLRERLHLTGAKVGCEESECGTCTVLLDSLPVNSCIIPAAKVNGKNVLTVEGMAKDGELDLVQECFIEAGAVQCGFCIPGVMLSARAILDKYADPTEEQMREELSGHLCRCTGYLQFFEAIRLAVEKRKKTRRSEKS